MPVLSGQILGGTRGWREARVAERTCMSVSEEGMRRWKDLAWRLVSILVQSISVGVCGQFRADCAALIERSEVLRIG